MTVQQLTRRINIGFIAGTLIGFCILSPLLGFTPQGTGLNLGLTLQYLVFLILIGYLVSKWRSTDNTRKSAVMLGASLLIVLALSLAGFYAKSYVVGEFDGGGTWVPDHAPLTALEVATFGSTEQVASLFGYSCNDVYGTNCSQKLYYTGFALIEWVLLGGVLSANVVVTQARDRKTYPQKREKL